MAMLIHNNAHQYNPNKYCLVVVLTTLLVDLVQYCFPETIYMSQQL